MGGEIHMANKAELVNNVAAETGLTKKDATAAVDAVFSSIEKALANGEKVQLIGLVTSKFVNVQLVRVVTHKLVKKSKSQQARFLHLSQVRP